MHIGVEYSIFAQSKNNKFYKLFQPQKNFENIEKYLSHIYFEKKDWIEIKKQKTEIFGKLIKLAFDDWQLMEELKDAIENYPQDLAISVVKELQKMNLKPSREFATFLLEVEDVNKEVFHIFPVDWIPSDAVWHFAANNEPEIVEFFITNFSEFSNTSIAKILKMQDETLTRMLIDKINIGKYNEHLLLNYPIENRKSLVLKYGRKFGFKEMEGQYLFEKYQKEEKGKGFFNFG